MDQREFGLQVAQAKADAQGWESLGDDGRRELVLRFLDLGFTAGEIAEIAGVDVREVRMASADENDRFSHGYRFSAPDRLVTSEAIQGLRDALLARDDVHAVSGNAQDYVEEEGETRLTIDVTVTFVDAGQEPPEPRDLDGISDVFRCDAAYDMVP